MFKVRLKLLFLKPTQQRRLLPESDCLGRWLSLLSFVVLAFLPLRAAGETADTRTVGAEVGPSAALSSTEVAALLEQVQQHPISLFLSLPVTADTFIVKAADDEGADQAEAFEITAPNVKLGERALGDLVFNAVAHDNGLLVSMDLLPLLSGYFEGIDSTIDANALNLKLVIDQGSTHFSQLSLEMHGFRLTHADGTPERSVLSLDHLNFAIDDADGQVLIETSFDVQGLSLIIDGKPVIELDSLQGSFQSPRALGKFLHEELNHGVKLGLASLAGLADPVDIIPDLLERWAPMFEMEPVAQQSTLSMGPLSIYTNGSKVKWHLEGLSARGDFDPVASEARTEIQLAKLRTDLIDVEADKNVTLLYWDGAEVTSLLRHKPGKDNRFIADILRATAADLRVVYAEAEDEAGRVLGLIAVIGHHGKDLIDGVISRQDRNWQETTISSVNADFSSVAMPLRAGLEQITITSDLDFSTGTDVQSISLSLQGVEIDGPEAGWSVTLGEHRYETQVTGLLTAFRGRLNSLASGEITMGDFVRVGLAVYLPAFSISFDDLAVQSKVPERDANFDLRLDRVELAFDVNNPLTDDARLGLRFEQSGVNLALEGEFNIDSSILDLALGRDGEPGLLPNDIHLEVALDAISMGQLLAVADTITLPLDEAEDISEVFEERLGLYGVALLSPFLSAPPNLVVSPSYIRGGLVEAEAKGSFAISPLSPPTFAEGQTEIRVTGLGALTQLAQEQSAALNAIGTDQAQASIQLLSQVIGLAMVASSLGVPEADGDVLSFVLEASSGSPLTINGLPLDMN